MAEKGGKESLNEGARTGAIRSGVFKETMHKTILAIETAIGQGSISLLRDAELIGFRCGESGKPHSTDLLSEIRVLLKAANVRKEEIDLIAVSTGPGGLTGARIGIASAKGLSHALNCQCVGISVLEASAKNIGGSSVAVVLPAGRDKYCLQFFIFESGEKVSETEIFVLTEEDLLQRIEDLKGETLLIEKKSYSIVEKHLGMKHIGMKIQIASDNLAEYVAMFFRDGFDGTLSRKKIEPLYVEGDKFVKHPV